MCSLHVAGIEKNYISLVCPLQVSSPVDYSNPPTVKNHNEVLRCFSLLGTKALLQVIFRPLPLHLLTVILYKHVCSD